MPATRDRRGLNADLPRLIPVVRRPFPSVGQQVRILPWRTYVHKSKAGARNSNPPNRFGGPVYVPDLEQVEHDDEYLAGLGHRRTEYIPDRSRTIVAENDSPDVGFRYSINPYRGCAHGCSYCYARPTHEYLGFNAGLDFETKILVKHDAPELFREFLCARTGCPSRSPCRASPTATSPRNGSSG